MNQSKKSINPQNWKSKQFLGALHSCCAPVGYVIMYDMTTIPSRYCAMARVLMGLPGFQGMGFHNVVIITSSLKTRQQHTRSSECIFYLVPLPVGHMTHATCVCLSSPSMCCNLQFVSAKAIISTRSHLSTGGSKLRLMSPYILHNLVTR